MNGCPASDEEGGERLAAGELNGLPSAVAGRGLGSAVAGKGGIPAGRKFATGGAYRCCSDGEPSAAERDMILSCKVSISTVRRERIKVSDGGSAVCKYQASCTYGAYLLVDQRVRRAGLLVFSIQLRAEEGLNQALQKAENFHGEKEVKLISGSKASTSRQSDSSI